jgi:predicted transcriptional regulator
MMNKDLMLMVGDIVTAHVLRTPMTREELTKTIRLVYTTLSGLAAQSVPETGRPERQSSQDRKPVVAIHKSVFPDYIVCLEDGRKLKTLKRHLMVSYGLSPNEYRAKWHLPGTYPMTAPNYANRRSEVARAMGLGHKRTSQKPVLLKRVKEGVSANKRHSRNYAS